MRLFPLLAVAGLALIFIWWFLRTPPEQVARMLRRALLWAGGALLIFLAATGRLHWLFALLGAAAPFVQRVFNLLQMLPLLRRLQGLFQSGGGPAAGPGGGRSSQVRTRFLHMSLDHESGDMTGQVLEGSFAGRSLADLSLRQLLQLLQTCREADPQSAAVLEAYLDRRHGASWRDHDDAESAGRETGESGPMSREQAYEILGLEPGADRSSILDAHRRLMQKLHPDRGGSTWLASRVNQAKDLLLNS